MTTDGLVPGANMHANVMNKTHINISLARFLDVVFTIFLLCLIRVL